MASIAQSSIRDLFFYVFKGNKNIMTPDVLNYGSRGNYAYELATGNGFRGDEIFGVTIIDIDTKEHNHELSEGGFNTLKDAKDYINTLN